jgi:hypothetical protein
MKMGDVRYICLHEAGHAVATYYVGGWVEFIELSENSELHEALTHVHNTEGEHEFIACGGYAAELVLFNLGRVDAQDEGPLTIKQFISDAMANAWRDKVRFFGANHEKEDRCWPEEYDIKFMVYANDVVLPVIERNFKAVCAIADELESKRRISRADIEAFTSDI